MNRNKNITGFFPLCISLMLLCMSWSMAYSAEQSSSNYSIVRGVMSGGGADAGSANYKLVYTIGQPTPTGEASGSSSDNYAGYWFLMELNQDNDNDGVINKDDDFPNDPHEWLDTDGDGTGNNADTDDDNDVMPDTWENNYGLNPLINDANTDKDGDGFSNLQEYRRGTDPNDPQSHPSRRAMPWLPLLLGD